VSPEHPPALQLVSELATERAAADRRFNLGLVTARATGLAVAEIAAAAKLSNSRVNAILEEQGSPFRALSTDEIGHLIENDFSVGLVPAGRIALTDYDNYSAYICQPNRSFRDEMDHLGFYARGQISPHFPRIRKTWEKVEFSNEEVERRRASGDPDDAELASIIERLLAAPSRGGHRAGAHKVFLLTSTGHPDTLTLAAPIKHLKRGRGQAFVRKQRYTTLAALKREPKTTAELLRFERS
jgi:hypothetical protein